MIDPAPSWVDAFVLLAVAHTTPVVVSLVLGTVAARPLDGGRCWRDGRPLLGPSKTWRGLFASLLATAAVAFLLDLPAMVGAAFASLAMLGDLGSSFVKRRLGRPSGGEVVGLDQLPESLLPLVAMRGSLHLPWSHVAAVAVVFLVLDWLAMRAVAPLRARRVRHPG